MRFFFHYNKPMAQKAKKPQITIHIAGKCHIVDNLECRVPTKGRIRKSQPFFVMVGWTDKFVIKDKVAILG